MKDRRPPSHEELDAALNRAASPMGAAGCHGFLCGLLCAAPAVSSDIWRPEILPEGAPGDLLVKACEELVEDLLAEARVRLASPDLGFSPLLPSDQKPLRERGRALSEWGDGFLYGLGLAGYRPEDGKTPEEGEFISDLNEITRLEIVDGDEADERALMELIEYVRVGVLLVSTVPLRTRAQDNTLH